MSEVLMKVRFAWVENRYDEEELARKGLAFPRNESVKEFEMDKEAAEIIASAIRAVGREIGTGDASTSMGGLELVAMEMSEGSKRIADAINNLAESIRDLGHMQQYVDKEDASCKDALSGTEVCSHPGMMVGKIVGNTIKFTDALL